MTAARRKNFQTHPSRFSPGRVHRGLYDQINKRWYIVCQPDKLPYGHWVDGDSEVTCKRCSRKSPV